jgi:polyisoprenoid-binding protein YceI
MTALDTSLRDQIAPGYIAGTWAIDQVHSEVGFTVRHLMVSKVRGRFTDFSGTLVTADDLSASSVEATVALSSIDTGNPDRDAHIRSADFFDVEHHPILGYRSTGIRVEGDGLVVDGELSLHGVTKSVPLQLEVNGFQAATPFGDTRAGFSATASIDRRDFGIVYNAALEGGGVALSNTITINLEVEAILQPATPQPAGDAPAA